MQTTLLSAVELTLGYRDISVIDNVTFEMAQGEVLCVVGHNGSGKSTLIKTLLEIIPPLVGTFDWPKGRPDRIAFLGQKTDFDSHFPIRVRDLAAMGCWSDLGLTGHIDSRRRQKIDDALWQTGIADIADMPLYKLSAGQLQRALFARTIVQDASLIMLDEPFTGIDQTTEAELLTLIKSWSDEGRSVILVLHDLSAVLKLCDSVLLLGKGKSQFGKAISVLTPENLVQSGYLSSSKVDWLETTHASKGGG